MIQTTPSQGHVPQSVDFTHPSLNGINGGQNKTIMDYGDPIHFTFFAVTKNGAGNGTKANFTYLFKKESGLCAILLLSVCYLHCYLFCMLF